MALAVPLRGSRFFIRRGSAFFVRHLMKLRIDTLLTLESGASSAASLRRLHLLDDRNVMQCHLVSSDDSHYLRVKAPVPKGRPVGWGLFLIPHRDVAAIFHSEQEKVLGFSQSQSVSRRSDA